jgi:hypothetical protein
MKKNLINDDFCDVTEVIDVNRDDYVVIPYEAECNKKEYYAPYNDDYKYCPYCGKKIKWDF